MKKILTLIFGMFALGSIAQPVARKVVAEHFTNTYCSICKANNPGFYSNLWSFPDVLHIAYYPSAPYAACTLNKHNKSENDARTNYYKVYGSTPRVVIQGIPVTGAISNPSIFTGVQGTTSPFEMKTRITELSGNRIEVKVVIIKKDTTNLINLSLYTAIVEDTLFFAAPNGENIQYDVFRKCVPDTAPLSMWLPVKLGDSVVYPQDINLNAVWNKKRIYAVSILSYSGLTARDLEQASKSNYLPVSTSAVTVKAINSVRIYPNPAKGMLTVEGVADLNGVIITDVTGKEMKTIVHSNRVDISDLPKGNYFITLHVGSELVHSQFTVD